MKSNDANNGGYNDSAHQVFKPTPKYIFSCPYNSWIYKENKDIYTSDLNILPNLLTPIYTFTQGTGRRGLGEEGGEELG